MLTGAGIVIYRAKHLDADHRLTILHQTEGKMIITAKGGQRMNAKLKSIQQPFCISDLHIYIPAHGVYGRLVGGRLLSSHHRIQDSYDRFSVASQCCEVIDLLFPFRAPSPTGFEVLRKTLNNLEFSDDPRLVWLLFNIDLLKALGHGDYVPEIIKFLDPHEQEDIVLWSKTGHLPSLCESARDESLRTIEDQLEQLLPRPLKTNTLNT